MNEIKIDKSSQSITFINNGIGFSQFGVRREILDLIENQGKEIEKLTAESTNWESKVYELQDEIERLNNIITELEKYIRTNQCNGDIEEVYYREELLDKLKELKENK